MKKKVELVIEEYWNFKQFNSEINICSTGARLLHNVLLIDYSIFVGIIVFNLSCQFYNR